MEQRHRDLLKAKRLEITSDLRFRDIRRHLVDNGILSGADLVDIEDEDSREDQVKALLDILPDRGPNAFAVFRDALKHQYPHLARILKDDGEDRAVADNEPRIFIIHAGEDKDAFVRPLVSTLRQQGLAEKDIFFDDISIKPGEVIRDRIISTLSSQSLELVVIVVSTSFLNKSYWPKLEYETCLRNNKHIFPIWVDANSDNFKAFSESVGKYSPTLKQMSARRVQRDDVSDELPNIATEVVRRVSTLQSTPQEPPAIQTLVYLAPSPSSSDTVSSDEDQGECTTADDDAQRVQDELKDKKAEQLELLKTLGGIDMGFLSQASQEGLMPKEQIAQMTRDMIRDIHQDGLRIIKVKIGCAIIHLVPNSLSALDAFWRDYKSAKLSTDFSQYLITDEMRTAVGKDLFIRVIMLEEQYRQWKHYFDAADMQQAVGEFQSLFIAPSSSVSLSSAQAPLGPIAIRQAEETRKEYGPLLMKGRVASIESDRQSVMDIERLKHDLVVSEQTNADLQEKYQQGKQAHLALREKYERALQDSEDYKQSVMVVKKLKLYLVASEQTNDALKKKHRRALQIKEEQLVHTLSATEEEHKQAILAMERRHRLGMEASEERHRQDLLAIENRRRQDLLASEKRHEQAKRALQKRHEQALSASEDRHEQTKLAMNSYFEWLKEDLLLMQDRHKHEMLATVEKYKQALSVRNDSQTSTRGSTGADQRQDSPSSSQSKPTPGVDRVYAKPHAHPSPSSPWKEEVNCYSLITHVDIASFLRDHRKRITEADRKLLQEAMTLVIKESNWVWNHAQITVYGEHMTVVFFSGERTNKYVVQLDSGRGTIHEAKEKGWSLAARDTAQSGFNWVKDSVRGAVSAAAGTAVGQMMGGAVGGLFGSKAIEWRYSVNDTVELRPSVFMTKQMDPNVWNRIQASVANLAATRTAENVSVFRDAFTTCL